MSQPLTIVAIIKAVPGHEDTLAELLEGLVAPTLAEAGCLQYDLHRDHEEPGRFLFFENWATKEEWLAHMESPHLAAYKKAGEEHAASTEIFQMGKV